MNLKELKLECLTDTELLTHTILKKDYYIKLFGEVKYYIYLRELLRRHNDRPRSC